MVEIAKISAESSRINREAATYAWLPVLSVLLGSTGMTGGIIGIIIALHK